MIFTLHRHAEDPVSTAGELLDPTMNVLCSTLERAFRHNAPMESSIPPGGPYALNLRKLGTSHFDPFYKVTFPEGFHQGMIEITVGGRSSILFHMGNFYYQSEGCVMCGTSTERTKTQWIIPSGASRAGYVKAYTALLAAVRIGSASLMVVAPPAPKPVLVS